MIVAGGTLVGFEQKIAWSFIFIAWELSLSVAIIILISRFFSKMLTYFLFGIVLLGSNFIEFLILKGVSSIGFMIIAFPSYKYYSYLELVVDNQFSQIWQYTSILSLFTICVSATIICLANIKFDRQYL